MILYIKRVEITTTILSIHKKIGKATIKMCFYSVDMYRAQVVPHLQGSNQHIIHNFFIHELSARSLKGNPKAFESFFSLSISLPYISHIPHVYVFTYTYSSKTNYKVFIASSL